MFGLNKDKQEDKTRRYMVMGKFTHSDNFLLEKQFINRHSADAYAELMTKNKEHDNYEYFLFEQSKAYSEEDTNE